MVEALQASVVLREQGIVFVTKYAEKMIMRLLNDRLLDKYILKHVDSFQCVVRHSCEGSHRPELADVWAL